MLRFLKIPAVFFSWHKRMILCTYEAKSVLSDFVVVDLFGTNKLNEVPEELRRELWIHQPNIFPQDVHIVI